MDLTFREQNRSALRIGIVTALFNREVTEKLEQGAKSKLLQNGVIDKNIFSVHVPGAVEIPIAAQALIEKLKVDAVIALGAVIRGETAHFDYVCRSVERGCMQVSLQTKQPVVFGVLTTDTDEQAWDRIGGKHGHKGEEAAVVALEMIDLLNGLNNQ